MTQQKNTKQNRNKQTNNKKENKTKQEREITAKFQATNEIELQFSLIGENQWLKFNSRD